MCVDGDVVPPSAASMAFVHYGGNLRARCYALKPADRLTAQRVVGRLVPSLVSFHIFYLIFVFFSCSFTANK